MIFSSRRAPLDFPSRAVSVGDRRGGQLTLSTVVARFDLTESSRRLFVMGKQSSTRQHASLDSDCDGCHPD